MHDVFAKRSCTFHLHLLNTRHDYSAMARALLLPAAHALLFACQLLLVYVPLHLFLSVLNPQFGLWSATEVRI